MWLSWSRQSAYKMLLIFVYLSQLISSVLSICPPADSITPCQCTVRAEEIQIWCSGSELAGVLRGLTAVGTGVSQPIDELILENNVITALPGRGFSPLRLVRLMLRDNRLERLAASWLAGLESSLLEVFIVEHELRSLPEDSFEGLAKMEAVTLKAGLVQRLPTFSGLPKLRYLHTELPLLTELPAGRLNGLEALEQLHIVGSSLLSTLPASSLQDIPRLVLANFSDCAINWIHPRAFVRLPSLKEIDLTANRIVDAGQIGRSVRELPHLMVLKLSENRVDILRETTFVDIPPLSELYLDNNRILEIQRGAFHRLPSLVKIDLSNNQIRRILPDFFLQSYDSRVEELILVNNQLEHVMQLAVILDTLPRLKFLDLSANRLQDVMFGALRGHPSLERLHLNGNRLKRVVREAFTAMPSLRELRLSNNSLSNYLEMPLWNLPNLKGLELSENEFRRLDRRVLANLPSLRRLDMSKNNLLVVDPASFLGTTALEHVNLSRNAIDSVQTQTFSHLNNLFELDMSWNKLSTIVPGLPRALEYLYLSNNKIAALPRSPSPDLLLPALRLLNLNGNRLTYLPPEGLISMPLLRRLYLGENMLSKIEDRSFDGLGRLEILSLADNRIQEMDRNALRDLRRMEELDLRGNRLARLDEGLLRENIRLRKIDLSQNQISQISKGAFQNNRGLEEVYLGNNGLGSFPNAVMELKELKVLDLSYNKISQLIEPLSALKSLTTLKLSGNKIQTLIEGTFSNMENLTYLDLESNEIQYITAHVLRSLPSLVSFRMSKNKLSTVPSAAFSDLPALTDVQLQENELTHIASDSFSGTPNLLMLNLSHNHLTSLDRAGLHGVKTIETLDLSHNRLAKLNTPSLPNLDSLIQLKMDGNKICSIQGSPFSKMTHLRMLSLRNNRLMSLSEHAFQPLRSTIYHLDIEGNPLKCSCSLLWLQSWVREGPSRGPLCSDGSLLKEREISPADCQQPNSSHLIRHCEDSPSGVGPTQQLSVMNNWKDGNNKPTPEESEYFYEEYVEYDDNVTLPINMTKYYPVQTTSSSSILISTTSLPTSIPPAVMSHFIPGDTPTLYARPGRDPPTKQKPQKNPSTTFTFFGMPLPSLSIGKFWGSSRNADGRSRFPGATKGHIQQIGAPPKVEEGFKPVLPARGGFRPIFNPYNKNSTTKPPLPTMKTSLKPFYDLITTTSSPPTKSTTFKSPLQFPDNFDPRPVNVENVGKKPDHSLHDEEADVVHENNHSLRYSYNNYTHQSIFQFNKLEPEVENTTPLLETNFQEEFSLPAPTPYTFPASEKPSLENPLLLEDSSEEGNDFVELTQKKDPEVLTSTSGGTISNGGPSPLSAFLAPGGQLPPFRSGGRPTITKVTMPPPNPVAEEIQAPASQGSRQEPPQQSLNKRTDKANDWYYANYNKTNLQPYIGPGTLNKSTASTVTASIFNLVVSFVFIHSYK